MCYQLNATILQVISNHKTLVYSMSGVRIVDFKTLRFAVCHIKVTTQTETEHLHYNIHEIIKALLILI